MWKKAFGLVLRDLRGERSQTEMAKFLGTYQSMVSRWERAQGLPDAYELRNILIRLRLTAAELYALVDKKEDELQAKE